MSKAKWIVKQYWRVGTIRALASLGLGMLVLGRYYYTYVPVLSDMGWLGAIILGIALILIFLGIGWLYDQKARMWSQKIQASVERNPYYYVPNFKNMTMEYPIFYTLIHTLKGIVENLGFDSENLNDTLQYMNEFFQSRPVKQDIRAAEKRSEFFMEKHPFDPTQNDTELKVPFRNRVKLAFETQMIRLTWIQALTGLIQDVLIFGALYVVVIFPTVTNELRLFLSLVAISLPLLLVLILLGWFYDRKFRIWSVDTAVKIERDPYSYVAEPYLYSRVFPLFYTFFTTLRNTLKVRGLPHKEADDILEYIEKYLELSVSRTQDLKRAQELRQSIGLLFQGLNQGDG